VNLVTLMPTRGRPEQAYKAWKSFEGSKANYGTNIAWVLDNDDDASDRYVEHTKHAGLVGWGFTGNMVTRTNLAASLYTDTFDIIGWAADDQLVRTQGWDDAILDAFTDPKVGMVQTNDLHYGPDKAANIFVRADIVRSLGYLALPTVNHLYVDDAWVMLGKLSESLRYLEHVVIEHMHPVYNKGEWDDQYRSSNDPSMYQHDYDAYVQWLDGPVREDAEKVRACLEQR
jgi:hypothetical protein